MWRLYNCVILTTVVMHVEFVPGPSDIDEDRPTRVHADTRYHNAAEPVMSAVDTSAENACESAMEVWCDDSRRGTSAIK